MNDNYNSNDQDDYLFQEEKVLIGYDSYTKEEIWSTDSYIRDKNGDLYLRENYLQANLDTDGNFIVDKEE